MKISLNTFFAKRHINFNQSAVSIPTYARTIQFVTMIPPPRGCNNKLRVNLAPSLYSPGALGFNQWRE